MPGTHSVTHEPTFMNHEDDEGATTLPHSKTARGSVAHIAGGPPTHQPDAVDLPGVLTRPTPSTPEQCVSPGNATTHTNPATEAVNVPRLSLSQATVPASAFPRRDGLSISTKDDPGSLSVSTVNKKSKDDDNASTDGDSDSTDLTFSNNPEQLRNLARTMLLDQNDATPSRFVSPQMPISSAASPWLAGRSPLLTGPAGAGRSPWLSARAEAGAAAMAAAELSCGPGRMPSGFAGPGASDVFAGTDRSPSQFTGDWDALDVPTDTDGTDARVLADAAPIGVRHVVHQITSATGKPTFDQHMLSVHINDLVSFKWYDPGARVVETDSSYNRAVPNGRNSKAGASASTASDTSSADGGKSNNNAATDNDEGLFSRSHADNDDDGNQEDGHGRAASHVFHSHCLFNVHFTEAGTYFFVCTVDRRRMRLRVFVEDRKSNTARHVAIAILLILLAICIVVVVVLVLAFWLKKKDLFLTREKANSEDQYQAIHKLQDLITVYLFPWLATGVMILLVLLLFAIGYAIFRCLKPRDPRREAQNRGFPAKALRVTGVVYVLLCVVITIVLFVAYGLQLNVTNGLNLFAQQLGTSLQYTVQNYSHTLTQVDWLVNESETLFPTVDIPRESIENVTYEIMNILNESSQWVVLGQDAIQGAFRILPILLFLTLQLGLFVSALSIGDVALKYRNTAMVITWFVACCVAVMACACGVVWAESKLLKLIYDSAVVIGTSPQTATAQFGIADDSFIAQLFSYCEVTPTDVSDIVQYVKDIVKSINSTMSCEQQQSFQEVANFITDLTPVALDALTNYSYYIDANVVSFNYILANNPDGVNAFFDMDISGFLQVAVNVISTAYSLVNCNILKQLIGDSIPILRENVEHNNTALFVVLLILFGLTIVQLVVAALFVLFLTHPRKYWYEARTHRWFRFRYSYVVHRHLLLTPSKDDEATTQKSAWRLAWLRRARPVMYEVLNARLVMYASSTLMFFDCILLVLFNNMSRTIKDAPIITAMSYLGCVQLILILGATLFRQHWMYLLLMACSLLVVVAVFVLSIVQLLLGYIHFGNCLHDARYAYIIGQLAKGHDITSRPQYEACPITYVGHELEVAVYASVMFLNCITLMTTMILVMIRHRFMTQMFTRRPYYGILLPMQNCCAFFSKIFKDHLYVRRVYVSVLIFVVVVFLVLFAVLNGSKTFRLIHTVQELPTSDSVLQVLKPTVACNGDPAYCNLRVNEMIWACTHNAHSNMEDYFLVGNHYFNITRQLHSGIRSFMIDLWYDKIDPNVSDVEDVYLCHSICAAGRRPFRTIAAAYADFLDTYPGQVVMLILEQYVNDTDIADIMDDVGLTKHVWYSDQEPPGVNPDYVWPTLQEMINKGQRLMMFNDAKVNSVLSHNRPEWMYYAYAFQYENDYQTDNVTQWRCKVGRGWCNSVFDLTDDDKDTSNSSSSAGSTCPTTTAAPDPGTTSTTSTTAEPTTTTTTTLSPEMLQKALRDYTNCSADPGPWQDGSDVYNAAEGRQPSLVGKKLSTLNHMITVGVGTPMESSKANIPESIRYNTLKCSSTWNQIINILAYDWWNIDNPLTVINEMNQNIVKYGPAHDFKDEWKLLLFGDANADVPQPKDEIPT